MVQKHKGKRRSNGQLARDRKIIADLYLQGRLQSEIAEVLNISPATVSRDIKQLQKEWMQDAISNFDEKKSIELAKIDKLERTYWDAWERSKQPTETQMQEVIEKGGGLEEGNNGLISKGRTTMVGRDGDPRYLAGVQWCIEKRTKILGLDAETKFDMTSKGERLYGSGFISIIEHGS